MTRKLSSHLSLQLVLVLVAALCGAGIGYYLFLSNPTYSAKSMLYVTPPTSSSPTDAAMGDQYASNRTQLYLQLVESNDLAERVAAALQSGEAPSALASQVKATGLHQAPLIEIVATTSSSESARNLAQAYADQLPDYARLVEQNSGIREGPVIVSVASPTEVTKSTAGWKPWLKLAAVTLLITAFALAVVLWCRRRHPTAQDIGALRAAVPSALVEELKGDQDGIQRMHALLFAAPSSARRVVFASARREAALENFTDSFVDGLRASGVHVEHVTVDRLDTFQPASHSNDIAIFDAPSLLDDPEPVGPLAIRSSTAVIVAQGRKTLVDDVAELARLLDLNGIAVRAVVSLQGQCEKSAGSPSSEGRPAADSDTGDRPWPNIEGLEVAMTSRNKRRTPE